MTLQDDARTVVYLWGEVNKIELATSRVKNRLLETWHDIDDELDENELETFKHNPVVQAMRNETRTA